MSVKKCGLPQNTYRGISFYFQGFILYSFPYISSLFSTHGNFLNAFFQVTVTVCLNINTTNQPMHPIIIKTKSFTKNIVIRNEKKIHSVFYGSASRLLHRLSHGFLNCHL